MSNNPEESYLIHGGSSTQPVEGESWGRYPESSVPAYTLEKQQRNKFVVIDNPTRFFVIGRVFKTLWSEPAGTTAEDTEQPFYNEIRGYSELSFSKVRRFVVVRKRVHSSLCIAISTYGGQGATKENIHSQDHALVFDASRPEPLCSPEEASTKLSFPIIVESLTEQIDPMSRLDFSRIYTVEHNVKVSKLGRISPECLPRLEDYFVASILGDQADNDMPTAFGGLESGIRGLGLQNDDNNYAIQTVPQGQSLINTVSAPHRYIKGSPGQTEKLDSSYRVRNKDYKRFFRVGRVFSTLWTEGVGHNSEGIDPEFISEILYQEKVHSGVRRFVVVRYREGDKMCTCLPITSYSGFGAKKHGITLSDHGFIYCRNLPDIVQGMLPQPLKLDLSTSRTQFTDPSLVHFGKVYTVETNVKVKDIGELSPRSKETLQDYFQAVFLISNNSTRSGMVDETNNYAPSSSNVSYQLPATGEQVHENQNLNMPAYYSMDPCYTQSPNYPTGGGFENTQIVNNIHPNYYASPSTYDAQLLDYRGPINTQIVNNIHPDYYIPPSPYDARLPDGAASVLYNTPLQHEMTNDKDDIALPSLPEINSYEQREQKQAGRRKDKEKKHHKH